MVNQVELKIKEQQKEVNGKGKEENHEYGFIVKGKAAILKKNKQEKEEIQKWKQAELNVEQEGALVEKPREA